MLITCFLDAGRGHGDAGEAYCTGVAAVRREVAVLILLAAPKSAGIAAVRTILRSG